MGETSLLFLALFVLLRSLRHHMEFRRAAVCAIACAALVACGGAQGRFASYLQRGKEYLEQGNLDKASIELRNALQIQPKSVEALYWNGRVAERKGDLRRAVGLYKAVVEAGPGKLDVRQRLVRIFLSARVPAEAQKLLESALKTEPDNAELLALRAATRAQLDDRAGAMADADRALKLAPDSEEAVQVRARLYQDGGDTAAAMQLVTSAVGRNPNSLPLREALVQMELSAGEEGKAEEQLRALIKAPPGDLKYRYQLATLLAKGHRLDDAQHVLEDAVKGLPHNDEVKLNLVDFISTLRSSGEGEKVLRGFIAGEPDHYSLRLALGALLQRTGSIPEAIRTYQEVIERDETGPSGLIARTRLASIAASQGRKDDARKLLAEVLQKNPRDNDALTLRAELALVGADPRAAITDLRAVLHDQPEAIGIRRLLARAYVAGGETALAEETLRSALDVAPADTGIRMELAQLDLDARHPDQAVVVLEQGVQKAPANLELREALVKAYVAKQDFAAAHTEAENLKTLRPEAGVGYFLAGQVEQAQQQLPAAQKEFERALQMEPRSFDYLTAVTRVQLARGQREQAIALVKSAAEHDHSNALVLNLLGQLYVGQKNYPSAIDALSRACALAPTWWLPEHNLAMAKSMNGDTAGAITVYEAALRAMPTEPNLIIGLASIREKAGQVDQAIENYEAFYKQNPQAQVVANNLAMLLITYKKDAASLNRALDLTAAFASSSDSTLLDTTGWVHFKRSEYSAALPPLQRAIERNPDSRQIRYHLGMTELRAGQIQRGRSDLEAALAGSANFPGSDEARAALAGLKNEAG